MHFRGLVSLLWTYSVYEVWRWRTDVAITTAAIAAVSARRLVGPSEAENHPADWNASSSSCVDPPSGPRARAKEAASRGRASYSLTSSLIPDSTVRTPYEA